MRILIIRHADPDYENDSLTAKGRTEAELLAKRLKNEGIDRFYCSPLGRAQETASYTMAEYGCTADTRKWLREFHAPVYNEYKGRPGVPWDMLPSDWTNEPFYYDKDKWCEVQRMFGADAGREAQWVYNGIDELLEENGYVREGNIYRPVGPNRSTIALFCHFGVECVILGHLLGISPVVLWQGACALPSSVTTLYSEERRKGTAYFRMCAFGDTGHLYAYDTAPSFSARFCETFDSDERHD